jgi:hypothetical protein
MKEDKSKSAPAASPPVPSSVEIGQDGGDGSSAAGGDERTRELPSRWYNVAGQRGPVTFAPTNTGGVDRLAKFVPKNDVYGVGFDPHKDAPEFARHRDLKQGTLNQKHRTGKHEGKIVTMSSVFEMQTVDAPTSGTPMSFGSRNTKLGLGALEEDDGDCDPYNNTSMASYDIELDGGGGGEGNTSSPAHRGKEGTEGAKLYRAGSHDARDLDLGDELLQKHIQGSKKTNDGRTALEGYVIADKEPPFAYPALVVPPAFKVKRHVFKGPLQLTQSREQLQQQRAAGTKLSSKERGKLLGEPDLNPPRRNKPVPPGEDGKERKGRGFSEPEAKDKTRKSRWGAPAEDDRYLLCICVHICIQIIYAYICIFMNQPDPIHSTSDPIHIRPHSHPPFPFLGMGGATKQWIATSRCLPARRWQGWRTRSRAGSPSPPPR